jgi:hypothetical protein
VLRIPVEARNRLPSYTSRLSLRLTQTNQRVMGADFPGVKRPSRKPGSSIPSNSEVKAHRWYDFSSQHSSMPCVETNPLPLHKIESFTYKLSFYLLANRFLTP